ncbi:transcription initiation at TATA-containing promoter protein [Thecaphora frezii]
MSEQRAHASLPHNGLSAGTASSPISQDAATIDTETNLAVVPGSTPLAPLTSSPVASHSEAGSDPASPTCGSKPNGNGDVSALGASEAPTSAAETKTEKASSTSLHSNRDNLAAATAASEAEPKAPAEEGIQTIGDATLGRSYPDDEATGMEPPVKKARTDAKDEDDDEQADMPMELTPQQLKFAQNTIKSLRSRREALAFLRPVDPIALGVPHYPQVIRKPMDLGTIDIKLALTAMVLKPNTKPSDKVKQAPQWNLDPAKDYYRNLGQFDADVRLVFSNCATFNGADSPFTQSAQVLEAAHDKYMKDAPPAAAAAPLQAQASAGGETAAERTRRPSNPVPTIRRSSSDANGRPKREIHPPPSKDLPWANEPQGASSSVVRKAVNRKAASRASNLSAREEAHYAKVAMEEIKFCTRVIDDLLKPSYQNVAWVFYELPERNLEWSPAYYSLIKKPTALRVIQRNIRSGKYADAEEFDAEMQQLFKNCFLFNPPDSDVYAMGKELKEIYEEKMKRKPAPPPLLPDYDDSSDDADEDAEGDDEDDADIDPEALARLSEQIAGLQTTLAALEGAKHQNHELIANTKQLLASLQQTYASSGNGSGKKSKAKATAGAKRKASQDVVGAASKKKGKAKTSAGSPIASSGSAAMSAAAATGPSAEYLPSKKAKQQAQQQQQQQQQKKKTSASSSKKASAVGSKRGAGSDDDVRVVTYEQKEELAAKICELSEERLDGAIRIINEDKPAGQQDEEEIELDIDELSPKTLYKLYKYVVRPSKKAAAAAAAAAKKANGRSTPLDGRKRGTGGLKKKNLDEGEEAERIARLQQQLEQFGNPDAVNSTATGMHDDLVHSESSSDGESGSDSDSD